MIAFVKHSNYYYVIDDYTHKLLGRVMVSSVLDIAQFFPISEDMHYDASDLTTIAFFLGEKEKDIQKKVEQTSNDKWLEERDEEIKESMKQYKTKTGDYKL